MREIKFRAWDKLLKKMYYLNGFEYYGEGFFGGNPEYRFVNLYFGSGGFTRSQLKNIHLMQHTGLKDKNGKEIYEGDVLTVLGLHGTYKVDFGIRENSPAFILNPVNCKHGIPFDINLKSLEIIGNIYENPELLKLINNLTLFPGWCKRGIC